MARDLLRRNSASVLPLHTRPFRTPTARALIKPADKLTCTGYGKVSHFISTDKELAVYRRFDRTAARLLLGLQSEIISKQTQLDELDSQDVTSPDEKRALCASIICEEIPEPRDPRDEKKKEICADLRKLVKEFYELLNAQSKILKLSAPSDRVKAVLFEWFDKENCLLGLGKKAYFEDHRDLIALRPARGEDRLSQFLKDCCSHLFEKKYDESRQPWDKVYYFPESRITKTVGILSTIMAALLLVGAIVSLYTIKGPSERLGLLAMWTILFAFSVTVLSTARRAEVFAATAAYAAVLVVFVSGNLASPSQQQ